MFQSILSQQPDLKFIPFISVFFFCRSERQSLRKIESMLFFLAADTCTHRGPIISANSKEAAHCGRFGALGTKNVIQKMARGRHGWVFLSLFIYFARLVAIIGGSYSKNCRTYRFKKFWNCLWRWFTLHLVRSRLSPF